MANRERKDDYKFLEIVDAVASINQRVNLIGVVVNTSVPKRTKGSDCFCTVKIIDESHTSPGISVNIFAENMEKLPHVETAGDIIQLSHVVMKTHDSGIYALFNKRFSSFALFEGRHSTDFVPYQVSSNFHARHQDKKFIVGLRRWFVDHRLNIGSNNDLLLKEIRRGESLNLVVKILHICEVTKDEWMLFVWDGTDTPPLAIQSKLEDEMENPLPLQLEPFPLSRDILCKFPAVGTVLRVIVDQCNEKLGLHIVKPGRWLNLINIKCDVRSGLWCGVLTPFTKLRYFPDDDDIILQGQSFYDERVASKWTRMPWTCLPWPSLITETEYPHVPFVTLMNVLTHTEVTAKFRCVVRVVAAFPCQAEYFCSPLGTYRIRLTLEDPTGRIHAFVYAEDGAYFFGGYPSADIMTRKRNMLLGIAESDDGEENKDAPRNPPWVQCCLKAYYLNKGDVWGSRNYRIFGTKLVG